MSKSLKSRERIQDSVSTAIHESTSCKVEKQRELILVGSARSTCRNVTVGKNNETTSQP